MVADQYIFIISQLCIIYQIFLVRIAFHSSDRLELNFLGFVIKLALNFKSRRTEKIKSSSQGPNNFQILGNVTVNNILYQF